METDKSFFTKSASNRKEEVERVLEKYPDRIPIIVEIDKKSGLPELDKTKYLISRDLTVGQFQHVIRKRISLTPDKAIFFFVNNTLPTTSEIMSNVYDKHKDEDGFLVMRVTSENTFG